MSVLIERKLGRFDTEDVVVGEFPIGRLQPLQTEEAVVQEFPVIYHPSWSCVECFIHVHVTEPQSSSAVFSIFTIQCGDVCNS